MEEGKRLVGTMEAAKYLGIHADTLRKKAGSWGLSEIRIGNDRRFDLNELDAFIEREKKK